MPQYTQSRKHRAAEHDRIPQRSAVDVFDDVRKSRLDEHFSHRLDEARPFAGIAIAFGEVGIRLARRRRMNGIERRDEFAIERERIGLDKSKRIVRLRRDIDAHHLEPRSMISDACTSRAAKQIQEPKLPRRTGHYRTSTGRFCGGRNKSARASETRCGVLMPDSISLID